MVVRESGLRHQGTVILLELWLCDWNVCQKSGCDNEYFK